MEYLNPAGLEIKDRDVEKGELLDSLNLVAGPLLKPVNVALVMFSDEPERFIPGCRIELVEKLSTDGAGPSTTVFGGPVDSQLRRVLQTIGNGVVKRRISKVGWQPEAIRFWNYPHEVLKEAIVNAVCYKDFSVGRPVEITVTPQEVRIATYPYLGPSVSGNGAEGVGPGSFNIRNRRLAIF